MKLRAAGALALAAAAGVGCGEPCEEGIPGNSDVDFTLTEGSGGGGVTAAGVWQLSLSPQPAETTCLDARGIPDEHYAYTLEFKTGDGGEVFARLVIGGQALVQDGTFAAGLLDYQTAERTEDDDAGYAITWRLVGNATLSADGATGVWSGSERIEVLESADPEIPAGCEFVYEVVGQKVCGE